MVTKKILRFPVLINKVLGVEVARGFGKLSELSQISRADVYDVEKNPKGTQRDLSPKHARDAYTYVSEEDLAFFPELVLCARDKSVWSLAERNGSFAILEIDQSKISSSSKVLISRLDGNHRLYYADGHDEKYPELDETVSFCLALNLSQDEEIKLFRDVNNNQRKMNTSHLEGIALRLTPEDELKRQDPKLYIANELADNDDSPLKDKVYKGGKSNIKRFMPLRALRTGLDYMFSRPTRLSAIDDIDVQTKLIKNYFLALKKWQPDAWEKPKEYLLLRGAGFWAACFLGAEIIDRALAAGKHSTSDMYKILSSGSDWDWSRDGDFRGFSGRAGSMRIRDMIVAELEDEGSVSLKSLIAEISKNI